MKRLKIVGIVAVLLLLVSLAGIAQAGAKAPEVEWNKTFGGTNMDYSLSVQQTSDGGYIFAGWTESYGAGFSDAWLVKTDSKGNEVWNKTFGGTDPDAAFSVQQTSDGGYIFAGETVSYAAGCGDVWLVKTDTGGNEEWNKTFGGTDWDKALSVQQTSDGGYILAGWTKSYGADFKNAWLIKTDSKGNKQWGKTFGGTHENVAYSVQQTSDGGYILVGWTESYGAGACDVWLVKTDATGNEEWDKTFGGTNEDVAVSVQQTSDGGYILAGWTKSYGAGFGDAWLVKTDSKGNEEWNKTFGGTDIDSANSVQQTSDGGYILVGSTDLSDVWLVKTDSHGNKVWDKTLGGAYWDVGTSVQQTSDGGYILIGSRADEGDVLVIKLEGDTAAPPEKETTPEVPTEEIKFDISGPYITPKFNYPCRILDNALLGTYIDNEIKLEVSNDEYIEIVECKFKASSGKMLIQNWELKKTKGLISTSEGWKTYNYEGEIKVQSISPLLNWITSFFGTGFSSHVDAYEALIDLTPSATLEKIIITDIYGDKREFEVNKQLISMNNQVFNPPPIPQAINPAFLDYKYVEIYSPAHILMIDVGGNKIGWEEGNEFKEIENAVYSGADIHPEFIIIFQPKLAYTLNVSGVKSGEFTLNIVSSNTTVKTVSKFEKAPATANIKASILISPEKVLEMKMDYDGDGTIDEEKKPVKEIIEVTSGIPTPTPGPPGFEAMSAVAGLLAVAYILRRYRK